jgi:hypothetical protein
LIAGRNSGPFLFMGIKENLENPNKILLGFGKVANDMPWYGLDLKAKYIFVQDLNDQIVEESLHKTIESLSC